jgi:hypothetical protein
MRATSVLPTHPSSHFGSEVFFSLAIHSRMYGEQCLNSVPFSMAAAALAGSPGCAL